MKKQFFYLFVLLAAGCNTGLRDHAGTLDPLPSWNDTPAKAAIVDFVARVTVPGPEFIPEPARIAVFDNDGTLWCEQPLYFEFVYSLAAMKDVLAANPDLLKKPEFAALAAGDMKAFMAGGEKGILEAFALSHTSVSTDKFAESAQIWLDTARHERFQRRYAELTYKPMVELLQFLRAKGFTTYIVSGGTSMFIREFSDAAYGVPSGQVIGTLFQASSDGHKVALKPEVFHLDDGAGKPVGIYQFIGRRPVLAFGNSDGDLEMLQYTATNPLPNLELILHHTDSIREYAYDRNSAVGKLDKALDAASRGGWVVVDMKRDFKEVFGE